MSLAFVRIARKQHITLIGSNPIPEHTLILPEYNREHEDKQYKHEGGMNCMMLPDLLDRMVTLHLCTFLMT